MNSPVVFNSEQLTILNTLNAYYLNNKFNYANSVNGNSPLVLNTRSGTATFEDTIPDGEVVTLRITNSLVTTSTLLNIGLSWGSFASNGILILAGYTCSTGAIDVNIYNADGVSAGGAIIITFQIL